MDTTNEAYPCPYTPDSELVFVDSTGCLDQDVDLESITSELYRQVDNWNSRESRRRSRIYCQRVIHTTG